MIIEHVIGRNSADVTADPCCEPIYPMVNSLPLEHDWKVEYVGKPMLARMMIVWYHNSSFMVLWRYTCLRVFLDEEAACIHIPRYKLITQISIAVWPDNLALDRKKDRQDRSVIPSFHPPETLTRLIQDFESLFKLRSCASIHILFNYPERSSIGDDDRRSLFLKGTAMMSASLCRLRNAGYILGASIHVLGGSLRPHDTFEYFLEQGNLQAGDSDCLPADDTGMVWR
jgi:hypothetical protein